MTAPAFVSGSGIGGGGTAVTLAAPAGLVVGNRLLAFIGSTGALATAPSGWTEVTGVAGGLAGYIFTKVVTASEPSTYTWTVASGSWVGGIAQYGPSSVDITGRSVVGESAAWNTAVGATAGAAGDTAVLVALTLNGTPVSTPSGTLEREAVIDGSGHYGVQIFDAVAASTSLPSYTGTLPSSTTWMSFVVPLGPPPVFTADSAPGGFLGAAYSYTYTASGSPAPTFAVASGAIPPGLTLTSAGVLAGTPTGGSGTFAFTVSATNAGGTVVSPTQTVVIVPDPVFTADSATATATVGIPYSYTFAATNGPAFSLATGALPGGLTLSGGGVLSGTPTATGVFTFTVKALNGAGSVNTPTQTVTVSSVPAFTAETPPVGTQSVAYTYTYTASGSPAPAFSLNSGTLPDGLTLSIGGVLSGTPTSSGTFTFTVKAANVAGSVISLAQIVIIDVTPAITSGAAPNSVLAAPYGFAFVATGLPIPTFSVTAGEIPPGLTLTSGGGLTGAPTRVGAWAFTVTATNSLGSASTVQTVIVTDPIPDPPPTPPVGGVLRLVLGSESLNLYDPDGNGLVVGTFDPGFPTIREVTEDLSTQDGQDDETQYLSSRVVAMTGRAAPSAIGGVQDALDQLNVFLDPGARPQLVWSTGPEMPERTLTMRVSQGSGPYLAGFVNWQAQWKCPDPVAYGVEVHQAVLLPTATAPGITFPWTFPLTFPGATSGPALYVVNGGNYQSWPMIRIYGPCTGPEVIWLDPDTLVPTGVQIVFLSGLVLASGDYIDIDTRNRSVTANGDPTADRFSFVDVPNTTWGPLKKDRNLLRYSGVTTASPSLCEVTWSDASL